MYIGAVARNLEVFAANKLRLSEVRLVDPPFGLRWLRFGKVRRRAGLRVGAGVVAQKQFSYIVTVSNCGKCYSTRIYNNHSCGVIYGHVERNH